LAEGVEEPAQYELLRRAGCDMVQGFLIARPMPVDQVLEMQDSWALQHPPRAEAISDSAFADFPDTAIDPPELAAANGGLLH